MGIKEQLVQTSQFIREVAREMKINDGDEHRSSQLFQLCDKLDREISQIGVINVDPPPGPINIATPSIIDEAALEASLISIANTPPGEIPTCPYCGQLMITMPHICPDSHGIPL